MNPDDDTKTIKLYTRRRFLPWLVAGVAGPGFIISLVRGLRGPAPLPPPPKYTGLVPRYRKRKSIEPFAHDQGFYLYAQTNAIHYFPEPKHVPFRGKPALLQPTDPTRAQKNWVKLHLPKGTTRKERMARQKEQPPHIIRSSASFAFEHEAVTQINQKNPQRAFELLIYAIELELRSHRNRPSFRLYDLLASMSVRFDRPDVLKHMIDVIQNSKDESLRKAFAGRIEQWQNQQSKWYRKRSNRSKQIKWKTKVGDRKDMALVLLM